MLGNGEKGFILKLINTNNTDALAGFTRKTVILSIARRACQWSTKLWLSSEDRFI